MVPKARWTGYSGLPGWLFIVAWAFGWWRVLWWRSVCWIWLGFAPKHQISNLQLKAVHVCQILTCSYMVSVNVTFTYIYSVYLHCGSVWSLHLRMYLWCILIALLLVWNFYSCNSAASVWIDLESQIWFNVASAIHCCKRQQWVCVLSTAPSHPFFTHWWKGAASYSDLLEQFEFRSTLHCEDFATEI